MKNFLHLILCLFFVHTTMAQGGDICTSATPFTVGSSCSAGATYSTTTFNTSITPATAGENIPATACAISPQKDMWYSVVVPASGNLIATIYPGTGTPTIDLGMAVYSGSCSSLALVVCDENQGYSNAQYPYNSVNAIPQITLQSRTDLAGQTVYIRTWANAAYTSTVKFCAYEPAAEPASNGGTDCASATYIGTSYMNFSTQYADMTFDVGSPHPKNGSGNGTFCITESGMNTIDNPVYYVFQAASTSGSVDYTGITCYSNGGLSNGSPSTGIQINVYRLGSSLTCPLGQTNTSTCTWTNTWVRNNGGNPGGSSFAMTGLVVGNFYLIFIDGASGDDCIGQIKVTGADNNLLPVQLVNFSLLNINKEVTLLWNTASENNSQYFSVQRSRDGINFSEIGVVQATGSSSDSKNYHFVDTKPVFGKNFYRLEQFDNDGKSIVSKVLISEVKSDKINISSITPNPANDRLEVLLFSPVETNAIIQVVDMTGKILIQQSIELFENINTAKSIDISSLSSGIYHINVSSNSQFVAERFVKL